MICEKPREWSKWLSLAKYWYNSNYHTSAKTTPYQIVYGQLAPLHTPYITGDSLVEDVDRSLQTREAAIKMLQFHLQRAQQRMKHLADKKRSDREFYVGDLVFLKLQPYGQKTIANRMGLKLAAKYFGPFKVLERIGKVAYKLELPADAKIHPIFHVSLLKKHVGNAAVQSQLPLMNDNDTFIKEPIAILDRR